jgi:hypothetical protein
MPRRARIDAPGALHYVICRGIERRKIFREDSDRDDFLKRLETILSATQTPCYAWALMLNHWKPVTCSNLKDMISTMPYRGWQRSPDLKL